MMFNSHNREPDRSAPARARRRSGRRMAIPVAVLAAGFLAFGAVDATVAAASTPSPGVVTGATITVDPSQADARFLKTIREHPFWGQVPDGDLVQVGHLICQHIDNGATMEQFISTLSELPAKEVEWLVGAAVGAYCPNHSDRISGFSEATAAYERTHTG